MDAFVKDPIREAADEASGFEGSHLHHNCKDGVVYPGRAPIPADFHAVLLMETAMHGWLWFGEDGKPVKKDLKRYVDVKPDRAGWDGAAKPNTSCLGVVEGLGVVTYASASWSVNNAFLAQLLKVWSRVKEQRVFPVVSFDFKPGQKDERGNFLPRFVIAGWEPRGKFASILGADPLAAIAPAPNAAPLQQDIRPRLQTVTTGRQEAPINAAGPPITDADDSYAGVDPGNVDFA